MKTFRFQTHVSKLYRIYVGGKLVEFNNNVADVDEQTAIALRNDPQCNREYFEVTAAQAAEAPSAKAPADETNGEREAAEKAELEAKAKAEQEAREKAEAEANAKTEDPAQPENSAGKGGGKNSSKK